MSSGENELNECKKAISGQVSINFDVFHIKDLSNKEAHQLCYSTIMNKKDKYSYFVKVDADMVFTSNTKLEEIINVFKNNPNLDHASFSVLDWASQKAIIGMHAFTNRCYWSKVVDNLFVDPSPSYPGEGKIIWENPAPVAWHSPNPSIKQSIQFGYHRTLKILQKEKKIPNLSRSNFQYDLMYQVYQQSLLDSDNRRLATLFGVDAALHSSRMKFLDSKENPVFDKLEEVFLKKDCDKLKIRFDKIWGMSKFKTEFFFSFLKFKIWIRYFIGAINKKLIS